MFNVSWFKIWISKIQLREIWNYHELNKSNELIAMIQLCLVWKPWDDTKISLIFLQESENGIMHSVVDLNFFYTEKVFLNFWKWKCVLEAYIRWVLNDVIFGRRLQELPIKLLSCSPFNVYCFGIGRICGNIFYIQISFNLSKVSGLFCNYAWKSTLFFVSFQNRNIYHKVFLPSKPRSESFSSILAYSRRFERSYYYRMNSIKTSTPPFNISSKSIHGKSFRRTSDSKTLGLERWKELSKFPYNSKYYFLDALSKILHSASRMIRPESCY